ncbi:MAG TPA: TolC family protein [Gemmataceae bacterium]|nr:TolC family protein [Gemmataceae bacterium]
MERFDRLLIVLTILLLPWVEPLPCRAQPAATAPPAPPPTASPPAPAPARGAVEPPLPPPRLELPTRPSQKSPLELSPPPAGEVVQMKLPPLEPGDLRFPINLATALRLADARPLIVAAAQAGAWVAEAQLQKAKVLWLPSFMMNAAYMRHDGPIDFNGGINVPQGQNALGQNTPGSFGKPLNQNLNWFISGVSLYQVVAVTDAIFQPLASRQDLNAKRWDIQTAKNDALLETARAYFNVHRYRGQYAGALYCVEEGRKLVAAINEQKRDLVPAVEVDRGRNLLAYLEQQAVSARENWRVASADLTQVLRLDPRAVVEPLEHDHLQLTLIDPSRSLDDLIPIGLTNRPELSAQQALIQAALVRIRQEKLRPLLPSILITGFQTPGGMTTQAGIFGTGNGGKLNLWSFRDDISTQLVWQLQNMGFGNLALVKRRRGEQSRATAALFQIQDAVASEITQSQATLQSAAARVVQAERALQTGLVTFQKNLEGLGQTRRFENVLEQVYRPQEVVYALKLLKLAFDEYFATVADYNLAQFQLFHALGYPASEIEYLRPPDGLAPVDTSRPGYLPAVGTGPPPVTR